MTTPALTPNDEEALKQDPGVADPPMVSGLRVASPEEIAHRRKKRRLSVLFLLFMIVMAVIISVVVVITQARKAKSNNKDATNLMGENDVTPSPSVTLRSFPSLSPSSYPSLEPSSTASPSSAAFANVARQLNLTDVTPESPAFQAIEWMADEDTLPPTLQRFTLVTFYYATGGDQEWLDQLGFLNPAEHECLNWFASMNDDGQIGGVMCSEDNQTVTALSFGKSYLNVLAGHGIRFVLFCF